MASTVFELSKGCTPQQLLQALRAYIWLRLAQWDIHVDEHGAWLANPYGVGCALIRATDEDGAGKLLGYIAAGEKIPYDRGHL